MKCFICDEKLEKDGDVAVSLTGEECHYECMHGQSNYASTAWKIGADGSREQVIFDSDFVYSEWGELPEPIKGQKWVNTDGWRGYTTWELNDGFKEVAEGWVTWCPDETTQRKVTLGELFEDLRDGEKNPPVDLWWVSGVTSNVFSSASSIIIRDGDEQALEEWLQEINGGIEGLQEKLN